MIWLRCTVGSEAVAMKTVGFIRLLPEVTNPVYHHRRNLTRSNSLDDIEEPFSVWSEFAFGYSGVSYHTRNIGSMLDSPVIMMILFGMGRVSVMHQN